MAQSSKQRAEEAVLDLKSKLRRLNKAVAGKGAIIDENAPLVATIKAVEGLKLGGEELVLTLYKKEQFYEWTEARLPALKFKEGENVSLRYTFSKMKALKALPEIAGIERTSDISYMCKECSSLSSVSLPALPLCTDASSAFYLNSSIELISIGDMPLCTSLDSFAYEDRALTSISFGSSPKVTNIYSVVYGCSSLEEFTASFGDNLSDIRWAFGECGRLRHINGVLNFGGTTNYTSVFKGCTSLEEVRLKGLKADLDLSACANLSMESIRYLVENAQTVTGKRIDLSRKLLEAHEEELGDLGDTASDKGFTFNYR